MFKNVLCCVIIAVISMSVGAENLQTVMSYYQPNMSQGFIFVSKLDMTLTLVDASGRPVISYPIACGRSKGQKQRRGDNRTPEGHFLLQNRQDASTWGHDFHDGKGFIKHAYGPWFLRLKTGFAGIGIHGTHAPQSIGTRATEGCIRLDNRDVDDLQRRISLGMPVIIGPEAGVQSLVTAGVPRPKQPGMLSQAVPAARRPKPERTVKPSPAARPGHGAFDAPASSADAPAPKPMAKQPEQPVVAEPTVEPPVVVTLAVETPVVEPEVDPIAAEIAAEPEQPAEAAEGPRYDIVVEEVAGPDGQVKYEVRYVLLP